ncbi:ribosomal protein S18-alanine N-acetyltransferase [Anaerolentibacter hominis]|uniref:ribosomal protein S18-alanine N-acetyltransferase n=1 Tax=Anaerolentibacter hominis TaxID=3079009 RepID=UPI0031B7F796
MIVRRMEPGDAGAAAELEAELFALPWSEQGFLDALDRPDTLYLAAIQEEKLAGYCGMWCVLDEAEITNVAVRPSFRRRGIGREMLTELIRRGRKRQISTFFLEVRESNEAAIRLYESLGFAVNGLRKNFYDRPRENAVLMILKADGQPN